MACWFDVLRLWRTPSDERQATTGRTPVEAVTDPAQADGRYHCGPRAAMIEHPMKPDCEATGTTCQTPARCDADGCVIAAKLAPFRRVLERLLEPEPDEARLIEKGQLSGVWGFELLSPLFEVFALDGGGARPVFSVANL